MLDVKSQSIKKTITKRPDPLFSANCLTIIEQSHLLSVSITKEVIGGNFSSVGYFNSINQSQPAIIGALDDCAPIERCSLFG